MSDKTPTAPKGRPTPKRRDAEGRRRGPVAPPPRTQREAMRRSRGSKEERREASAARKKAVSERRERMAAGDEKYLLPRDKGPVRAYARDVVDSRRHLLGLFMPLAVVVLIAAITPSPVIQFYAGPATVAALIIMIIDGIVLGVSTTRRARVKFPDARDTGFLLGLYAMTRAGQPRKFRMPKPRVKLGDKV